MFKIARVRVRRDRLSVWTDDDYAFTIKKKKILKIKKNHLNFQFGVMCRTAVS